MMWHERVVKGLKANDVRLVTYIPDTVLSPLLKAVHADRTSPHRRKSLTASTVDLVERALKGDGPWLIGARIDGAKPAALTERDPADSEPLHGRHRAQLNLC